MFLIDMITVARLFRSKIRMRVQNWSRVELWSLFLEILRLNWLLRRFGSRGSVKKTYYIRQDRQAGRLLFIQKLA